MPIQDVLKLADEKLADTFKQKPHDPTKARKPFLKHLDTIETQFASTAPARGKRSFRVNNGVVEYRPPVPVHGSDEPLYIPHDRFGEFLTGLRLLVQGGELDDKLQSTGRAKASTSSSKSGRGWSPERRAAFEAKRAGKASK